MKIIISPYSKMMRNKKNNPKNYPYWSELVSLLTGDNHEIIQIGIEGEPKIDNVDNFIFNSSLKDLEVLLNDSDAWISVDNFFQHLASHHDKRGMVIFSKSDPNIFGYSNNVNVLKDRKYLRKHQFDIWEKEIHNKDSFSPAEEIYKIFVDNFCEAGESNE